MTNSTIAKTSAAATTSKTTASDVATMAIQAAPSLDSPFPLFSLHEALLARICTVAICLPHSAKGALASDYFSDVYGLLLFLPIHHRYNSGSRNDARATATDHYDNNDEAASSCYYGSTRNPPVGQLLLQLPLLPPCANYHLKRAGSQSVLNSSKAEHPYIFCSRPSLASISCACKKTRSNACRVLLRCSLHTRHASKRDLRTLICRPSLIDNLCLKVSERRTLDGGSRTVGFCGFSPEGLHGLDTISPNMHLESDTEAPHIEQCQSRQPTVPRRS